MLSLKDIKSYYPENLHVFNRFVLREYLQYKILEIVFESQWANQLCFLGGTCLRIVHGNTRFSEDLDFDNFSLNETTFDSLAEVIQGVLQKEGYQVEMKTVYRGAYHCHIKFPRLLFQEGLSNYEEERILIQLDTEAQGFPFQPDTFLLNRFDVFTRINTTPKDLLLAQKCYAILNRKRNKGRDFYDAVFLLGQNIKPNYAYLKQKLDIESPNTLKERLLTHCEKINMADMAKDVQPFLFAEKETRKVTLFANYIKQTEL